MSAAARAEAILASFGDRALYEEMRQALVRGMAEGIDAREDGVFLYNAPAEAYMLAPRTDAALERMLDAVPQGASDVVLHGVRIEDATRAGERFGLTAMLCFVIYAYYGPTPDAPRADIRPLGADALPFVCEHYAHASREYLAARLASGTMLGAYTDGRLAGFIGEHAEGAMGLLYVLPEYRREHLGYALETAAIRRTLLLGQVPFGQVYEDNAASHALQRKLGMTASEGRAYWLMRGEP